MSFHWDVRAGEMRKEEWRFRNGTGIQSGIRLSARTRRAGPRGGKPMWVRILTITAENMSVVLGILIWGCHPDFYGQTESVKCEA